MCLVDYVTSIDVPFVPFKSRYYYVHLHGLDIADELSKKLREGMNVIEGHSIPSIDFFLEGYVTFFSCHRALPKWAINLSHKKQISVIESLKENHHTALAKIYNFIDDHTTIPNQKYIYSLLLLHPQHLLKAAPNPPAHLLEMASKPDETIRALILNEINTFCLLLRMLGFSIITPFISNVPYSNFFTNRKRKILMASLDDSEPRRTFKGNDRKLTQQDLDWIKDNFSWLHNKLFVDGDENMAAFEVPFQMLTNDIYAVDPKVRFFTAWNGLESLLKPGSDNIGPNIVNRLTSDGLINKKKAKRIKEYRNKIIHGDVEFLQKHESKLPQVALDTRNLLCEFVKFFIENEIIPTKEYLDEKYGVIIREGYD